MPGDHDIFVIKSDSTRKPNSFQLTSDFGIAKNSVQSYCLSEN